MSSRQSPVAGVPFPVLVHETGQRETPAAPAATLIQETIVTVVANTTQFFFGT